MMCNPYDTQYTDRLVDVAVDASISQSNLSLFQPSPAIAVCFRKLGLAHFFGPRTINKARVDESNSDRCSFTK